MFSPVPVPSVPVVPNSPVPVFAPKAVPPNAVGLAPNRPPGVLDAALNALVPRPVVPLPKLNPVWGLFCAPNKLPVAPAPRADKKKQRRDAFYVDIYMDIYRHHTYMTCMCIPVFNLSINKSLLYYTSLYN